MVNILKKVSEARVKAGLYLNLKKTKVSPYMPQLFFYYHG